MSRSRGVVVVTSAALVGGLLAGGAALLSRGTDSDADLERVPGSSLRVAAPGAGTEQQPPEAVGRAARSADAGDEPAPPTRVGIEAVDVSLPVVPMGVDDQGLMALPRTPFATSWYRFGADPTDPHGAVVVSGHVDTAEHGAGPLARLAGLPVGAEVVLDHRGGSTTYTVVAVRQVAKTVLDLPAVFRRTGPPRLHLITCGGSFVPDRGGYQDNVVVVAEPTP